MYRKYFTICAALSYGLSLFAQNAQTNDQLELPDVTTVINTENLKVENDALPDFNDVLEVSGESGTVTAVLPDVDNQDTQVDVVTEKSSEEKTKRLALADTYHARTSESAFFFFSTKSAYSASNRSSESPSHFAAFFAVIVA